MAEGYGSDPKITRILDEQAVYVVPRLNPDGAELALAEKPQFIRSGTRPYPYAEKRDGLHEEDLDGDGRDPADAHRRPHRRLEGLGGRPALDARNAARTRRAGRTTGSSPKG